MAPSSLCFIGVLRDCRSCSSRLQSSQHPRTWDCVNYLRESKPTIGRNVFYGGRLRGCLLGFVSSHVDRRIHQLGSSVAIQISCGCAYLFMHAPSINVSRGRTDNAEGSAQELETTQCPLVARTTSRRPEPVGGFEITNTVNNNTSILSKFNVYT